MPRRSRNSQRFRISGNVSRERELEIRQWYRSHRWQRPKVFAYVDGRGRTVIQVTDRETVIWNFLVGPDDTVADAAARERTLRLLSGDGEAPRR